MPLFPRLRRPLAIAVLVLLAIPALMAPLTPQRTVSVRENRVLAPAPAWPHDLAAARKVPRQIDAYLADHFAFRDVLVRVEAHLLRRFGGQIGRASGRERVCQYV